jgi:transposase
MLRLPATLRVFLCPEATDMRRSFDGLSGLIAGVMREDPLSGHLYVFRNKNADKLKVLYWDKDGLVIYYKRLEKGTFRFPPLPPLPPLSSAGAPGSEGGGAAARRLEVPMREFAMILEGFELTNIKKLDRFRNRTA